MAIYVGQVLEGLLYLHEQGVIHRDIKGAVSRFHGLWTLIHLKSWRFTSIVVSRIF